MDAPDRLWKHLMAGFGLALVIYVGYFALDQHLRRRKGAWEVQFTTNSTGMAEIVVNEPALGITNVQIVFLGEHPSARGTVLFDKPEKPLPFGKSKFEDLTFLPGSEAFDFFGHEVELLPRTLYLNKQEQGWTSGKVFELRPEQKLPPGTTYDPRARRKRR
jgi:hypothetical protein